MSTQLNKKELKKLWFIDSDIDKIKRWINDVENGNFYTEEEFYSRLEKRIFSKNKAYV